jgi:hypothetical protein
VDRASHGVRMMLVVFTLLMLAWLAFLVWWEIQ